MADQNANPFSPRIVAAVVLGGIVAFLGFLFLTAYAPQMKLRGAGGVSALSKSAVGFYGLYHLAEATGRPVDLAQTPRDWLQTGFMIVTIDADTDVAELKKIVAARRSVEGTKTLYILPKWGTMPLASNRRWVQSIGTLPPEWSRPLLGVFGVIRFGEDKAGKAGRVHGVPASEMASVDAPLPQRAHYIVQGMTPVLADDRGHVILGRTDLHNGAADYILADPDLLSNQGLKTAEGARAALAIVDAMRFGPEDSVAFDLVLNGLGGNRNLLQLMFEPPFLALTIAVLAAALLVGVHAFGRFGPAVAEPRAIPFGKRALADNAAILIGRAGAVRRLGDRYVALTRDAVAGALGAGNLDVEAQEEWLARLPRRSGGDFATLAATARAARDSESMRSAARALHDWRNEVTRDR